MLKLYRARFSKIELCALTKHCLHFCPYGEKMLASRDKGCQYRGVCRDLQRLAIYAGELATQQTNPSPNSAKFTHC